MTIETLIPSLRVYILFAAVFSATVTLAQTDALYISPQGGIGIGTSTVVPGAILEVNGNIKLGLNKKIWWDWEQRAIDVVQYNGGDGVAMRFRNSMDAGHGNAWGGFDFTDNESRSVLRILNNRVGIGNNNPMVTLDVTGDIRASGTIKDRSGVIVPVGGIIMYAGSTGDFDKTGRGNAGSNMEGWAICDGRNGTPNLKDRFVVGAGASYAVGAQGGEATHTLTIAEMPSHDHIFGVGGGDRLKHNGSPRHGTTEGWGCQSCAEEAATQARGMGQPHENRPPYYAVYYIMKM